MDSEAVKYNLDWLAARRGQAVVDRLLGDNALGDNAAKNSSKDDNAITKPAKTSSKDDKAITKAAKTSSKDDNAITKPAKTSTEADNTITKALGVLQENGLYACILYLYAKEGAKGKIVVEEMLTLLDNLGFGWNRPDDNSPPEKVLSYIAEKVTVKLEPLLLAKETLEQMLIYARYGAKARKE